MCPCAPPHNRSDRKAGDRATVTRCVAAPVFPLKSARSRSPSGFRRNRRRRISLSAGTWRRRTRLPVGRLIRETASPLIAAGLTTLASASWSVEIPPTPLLQRRIGCEPNLRGYHRTSFGHHRDTDKAERRLFRARIQCVAPPEAAPFLSNATGRIVTMRTTPSKAKQSA